MKKQLIVILFSFVFMISKAQSVDFTFVLKGGCDTALVTFTDKSVIPDTTSFYCSWEFGNGQSYTTNKYFQRNPPVIRYANAGTYSPTLYIGVLTKTKTIIINPSPDPYFQIFDTAGIPRTYVFKSRSNVFPDSCYSYIIRANVNDTIPHPNFTHSFDTSVKKSLITLTIVDSSKSKCTNSYTRELFVYEKLNVPNYISPDNNGINDFFVVPTNGTTKFRLSIFTRTGLLIYKSESISIFWDGYLGSGELVKPATYFYIIETLSGAINYQEKGFIIVAY